MESKQTDIWAVCFITFAAATIITAMRLLSRRLKHIPLSWDDYFALCGYVSFRFLPDILANFILPRVYRLVGSSSYHTVRLISVTESNGVC
jgi:hypothetical protein